MFGFKKKINKGFPWTTDIHSHLLPGIDDGVQSEQEAIETLAELEKWGYRKLIITPHIKGKQFPNTPETIRPVFNRLLVLKDDARSEIELELGAEYYLDSHFKEMLERDEPLLTFGDNYLLIECSMQQEPLFLPEILFRICEKGYQPIMAHPERYGYLPCSPEPFLQMKKSGCLLQMNLMSPAKLYGTEAAKKAKMLLKEGLIDLVGTDCHSLHQARLLSGQKNVRKILEDYPFKNNFLFK